MDDKLHAMVGGFSQRPRPDDFDDEFDEMETASNMENFSPVEEKYAVDGADPSSDAFPEGGDESTYDEGGEGSEGEIERPEETMTEETSHIPAAEPAAPASENHLSSGSLSEEEIAASSSGESTDKEALSLAVPVSPNDTETGAAPEVLPLPKPSLEAPMDEPSAKDISSASVSDGKHQDASSVSSEVCEDPVSSPEENKPEALSQEKPAADVSDDSSVSAANTLPLGEAPASPAAPSSSEILALLNQILLMQSKNISEEAGKQVASVVVADITRQLHLLSDEASKQILQQVEKDLYERLMPDVLSKLSDSVNRQLAPLSDTLKSSQKSLEETRSTLDSFREAIKKNQEVAKSFDHFNDQLVKTLDDSLNEEIKNKADAFSASLSSSVASITNNASTYIAQNFKSAFQHFAKVYGLCAFGKYYFWGFIFNPLTFLLFVNSILLLFILRGLL
jgi:flagellar biosynthesis chaperone FliJ